MYLKSVFYIYKHTQFINIKKGVKKKKIKLRFERKVDRTKNVVFGSTKFCLNIVFGLNEIFFKT